MCSSTTVTAGGYRHRSQRAVSGGWHRTRPSQRGRLLSGGRTLAERYLHGALLAIPLDREGDLVVGLLGVDRGPELVAGLDRLSVDGGDDVAGLQARIAGGAAGNDLGEPRCPVVGEADAEVGMLDAAALDQLGGDALSGFARDRVADAVAAAGLAGDLRRDAHDATLQVEHRAAGVAVVERGIRLDRVLDGEAVGGLDLATE